jgi:nicotinic acid mononucleotide adenylyltransferase
MKVERLSEAGELPSKDGATLVMVGSFAPVHPGHFDAMSSAKRKLQSIGEKVDAAIFAPNSDSYVSLKLNDIKGEWNFANRVAEFLAHDSLGVPTYVDDITGSRAPERTISEEVIDTISRRLGITACRSVLVVGSDQVASMRPHLETNRAICVLRPQFEDHLKINIEEEWLRQAIAEGTYMVTTQEDPELVISSTAIRKERALLDRV